VPAYFLDSSALVKCYIAEIGSVWTRAIVDDEGNVVYVASLARVETISAVTRRFRRGEITQAEFDVSCNESKLDMATQYEVVGLSDRMIGEAAALAQKQGLRAYDAVQLAAALDTSRIVAQVEATPLTLVSADLELNMATAAEGLQIEDPNTHWLRTKQTVRSGLQACLRARSSLPQLPIVSANAAPGAARRRFA
jgi:predicted nucleic acid-binding protein